MKTYWNYSHIYHLVQFKNNNNKSVHWYERFRTILGYLLFTSCVSQKSRQDLINLVYAILSYFLSIIYFTQPVSGVKKQQKKRNFGSCLLTMPRESVSQSERLARIFYYYFSLPQRASLLSIFCLALFVF